MEGEIVLISDATRLASKFLLRDYYELEHLQNSINNNSIKFAENSRTKIAENIKSKLDKYFKNIFFNVNDITAQQYDKAILIEPINGFNNFCRSLPFFSSIVSLWEDKNGVYGITKSVINFPALGDIYYVEKGKGVWLERFFTNQPGKLRLRASQKDNINNIIASTNLNYIDKIKNIQNINIFDCLSYSLALFVSAKIDLIIFDEKSNLSTPAKIFIEEASASYRVQDNLIYAANLKLLEKIKQF